MVWYGLESALSRHDETNIENPPSAFAPGGFLQNAREGSVTWITRPLLRRKATGQNWPESRRARFCGLPRLEPRGQGRGRIGSVRGKAGQLDGSGPQLAVGGDHGGKLRRRVADRLDAESPQLLDEGAIFGYPPGLRGNAVDDRLRRAGGSP